MRIKFRDPVKWWHYLAIPALVPAVMLLMLAGSLVMGVLWTGYHMRKLVFEGKG